MNRYEEVDHTADWAFRAFGSTLPELYENAAFALFALEGALDAAPTLQRTVEAQGVDREALLVNWLNELLFLQETQNETYQKFQVLELTERALRAEVSGAKGQPVSKFIKAVTFHDLKIEQTASGWQVTIVVDV